MAVRRTHHGNLDVLIAEAGDASGPLAFDRGPSFEVQAKLAKEVDGAVEVIDDDSDIAEPQSRAEARNSSWGSPS